MPHVKGKPAWNKGLKGVQIPWNKGKVGTFKGKKHSEESKRKISLAKTINNKGGRCKWFEVAGQKVQGTWEKNIAEFLEKQNIKWEKIKTNRHTFTYILENKTRSYSPDFYLEDYNLYLEIKGYWWGNDKNKMAAIAIKYPDTKIVVIEKEQYEKILRGELVW